MKRLYRGMVGVLVFFFIFCSVAIARDRGVERHHGWQAPLSKLVSIKSVAFHQKILEAIADNNDGNRAAGTTGYDDSANYVALMLRLSGYKVDMQEFEFPYYEELSDPEFEQLSPNATPYTPNHEDGFVGMTYSGSGDVTGTIQAVDVMIPPGEAPNSSTSGCEEDDFVAFVKGNVALIQRGSCSFHQKALNAQKAGASAVIIFNEGQEGRRKTTAGTLGTPDFDIPVIFSSYAIGEELYNLAKSGDVTVRVKTDTTSEIRTSRNIIATTRHGDAGNTVVAGAHLDSVAAGPGINDNGSGTATLLETAMKMSLFHPFPKNRVVFAFWGAEELGLIGSTHYVENLTEEELSNIELYLNFDMVASPNYVRFAFDGDGSHTDTAGPAGSGAIEQFFVDYFAGLGLATDPTELDGRSDYAPFMRAGVPVGGLFTGAGGMKTEEQAAKYGGVVGEPYDPYYHTEKDDVANCNLEVEEQMLKAIAESVQNYAEKTLPAPPVTLRAASPAKQADFEYLGPYLRR